jgi:aspartate kinase
MIVMKFGGSSLESAEAIDRVAGIIESRRGRKPVVVVSAMGKTTNALLKLATTAAKRDESGVREQLGALRQFHESEGAKIAPKLEEELRAVVDGHFAELSAILEGLCATCELTRRTLDAVASFGERLSSHMVSLALRGRGIPSVQLDARKLIVTDDRFTHAAPLVDETYERIAASVRKVGRECVPVMGGFIGATREGITTTIGRGGSDYTAALVGAAIDADDIEIWTDVDGVLTCDPQLVPEAYPVRRISFDEAAEMAYFGAKVLHPATVLPAKEKNIPVWILNSRRPEAEGTQITADAVPCKNILKSIACKRGVIVVNLRSTRMLGAHGFLRRIFEVFDRHETAVDMISTSEVSVSLTIDSDAHLGEIRKELDPFTEVSVERDQAILCAVGDNVRHTPGVAARVFDALKCVNVRMISQGASRLNLGVVVDARDLQKAASALHEAFFTERDPAVFG